jgi:hypothetical protein
MLGGEPTAAVRRKERVKIKLRGRGKKGRWSFIFSLICERLRGILKRRD